MIKNTKKKLIVISAVNLVEGGTLTILRDCVESAEKELPKEWRVIALVNNKNLFFNARVKKLVIDKPKKSWFFRLYYEYIGFYFLSKRLNVDLWLSLHDTSPIVKTKKQAVYCHNPSPFYQYPLNKFFLSPTLWFFNKFYKYLYWLNIHKNDLVIVQQEWIRKEFIKMFGMLPVVVAYPELSFNAEKKPVKDVKGKNIFLYPAIPRVFKNIELLCEAANILLERGLQNFEVRLTVNGKENAYSRKILSKFSKNANIIFTGYLDKESMDREYANAKVVVFPSRLETWGLPITEAKSHNKQLLIADLKYAKETVGTYKKVTFFDVNSARMLADCMEATINNEMLYHGNSMKVPEPPFVESWRGLWEMLIFNG